jgi:hypothetical protein
MVVEIAVIVIVFVFVRVILMAIFMKECTEWGWGRG